MTDAKVTTVEGKMEPQQIEIVSEDNVKSRISVYRTITRERPVIICMPAMGVRASYYDPLAQTLVEKDWNVITADLRGHGESSVRPREGANFGCYEMIRHDFPAIVGKTKELFPQAPVFLLGHSLGGQLSALYMSVYPQMVDGLILVASCTGHHTGWPFPHNFKILFQSQLALLLTKALGYFPGDKVGFAGAEAERVMRDWWYNILIGKYKLVNSPYNFEQKLATLNTRVLVISFSDDHFAPKRAVENLWRKMKCANVTHWHLSPRDLGQDSLGHFRWVKECVPVVTRMHGWLQGI